MAQDPDNDSTERGLSPWLQVDLLRRMGVEDIMLQPPRAQAEEPAVEAPAQEEPPATEAAAPMTPTDTRTKAERLAAIAEEIAKCRACQLCDGRQQVVPGDGNPDADVVFIGEAPGQQEDMQGLPFVGPAGQLLNKMIAAMGLKRADVHILNIIKCRPPGNRTPVTSEIAACRPHLVKQLEVIEPKVIITLGAPAVQGLLDVTDAMGLLRGRWREYLGIRVLPTYHPAYLLRSPSQKDKVWPDLKIVIRFLKKEGILR